jgi:hypothetical protein
MHPKLDRLAANKKVTGLSGNAVCKRCLDLIDRLSQLPEYHRTAFGIGNGRPEERDADRRHDPVTELDRDGDRP